ncbi:MAG: hypothetical protein ACLTN0_03300 [Coprococcus phoceensis]
MIQYEFGANLLWKIRRFLTDLSLHWKFLTKEGCEKYDEMDARHWAKLNDIVVQAKKDIVPDAIKWAWEFKDDSVIYTMGSGALLEIGTSGSNLYLYGDAVGLMQVLSILVNFSMAHLNYRQKYSISYDEILWSHTSAG